MVIALPVTHDAIPGVAFSPKIVMVATEERKLECDLDLVVLQDNLKILIEQLVDLGDSRTNSPIVPLSLGQLTPKLSIFYKLSW